MQFEDFDRRIKEAAENHHPSYDGKAWTKMESLLDKHLPTKKDNRKRIFFFLLTFLLLGGGTWLLIDKPWTQSTSISDSKSATPKNANGAASVPVAKTPDHPQDASKNTLSGELSPDGNTREGSTGTTRDPVSEPVMQEPAPGFNQLQDNDPNAFLVSVTPARKAKDKKALTGADKNQVGDAPRAVTTVQADSRQDIAVGNKKVSQLPVKDSTGSAQTTKQATAPADLKALETMKKTDETLADNTSVSTEKKKQKTEKRKNSSLAFTLSAGPDISTVGLKKTGRITPVYGIGLSYTIQRFTIRSGFFKATKIYTAQPADYKFSSPPPNISYLEKIDANCKVIEIPLTVAYNFSKSKDHSWFGAAGLSSYLMKEEDYDYYYRYPNGQTYVRAWNVYNKNKHIFSVLSLSGGYTKKLNKTFSVSAEPYLKIPLTGIGAGKLQLNSGGVLFTISAQLLGEKR